MDLMSDQEKANHCQLLAAELKRRKISLSDIRQNIEIRKEIARFMKEKAGLRRDDFLKLIEEISLELAREEMRLRKLN